jgi:hypothetical protein
MIVSCRFRHANIQHFLKTYTFHAFFFVFQQNRLPFTPHLPRSCAVLSCRLHRICPAVAPLLPSHLSITRTTMRVQRYNRQQHITKKRSSLTCENILTKRAFLQ